MFASPTELRASTRKITLPPPRDIRVQFHSAHAPASLTVSFTKNETATTTANDAQSSQPDQPAMRIPVE